MIKALIRAASAALTVVIILSLCMSAYGANIDYLSAVKWEDNPKVKSSTVTKTSIDNTLSGKVSYIKDNNNLTLYTYFKFTETTLQYDDTDDVRVIYEIKADEADYTFTLNSFGMEDETGQSELIFDAESNIYPDASSVHALSYAQYNGKSTKIKVTVYLFVRNSRYLVIDGINLKIPEKTTKKKETTTKKTTTKKSKTTTAKRTTKGAKEKTTKFDAKTSVTKYGAKSETTTLGGATTFEKERLTAQPTKNARYLLIAGIILLVMGLIIGAYCLGKSKADDEEHDKETTEE